MVSNLPAVVFHQTVRGFKKARKQAQRGVKAARYVAGRVRSAEKSFYFHLRDTRAGRALLEAATFARAPRELSERRRAAAEDENTAAAWAIGVAGDDAADAEESD